MGCFRSTISPALVLGALCTAALPASPATAADAATEQFLQWIADGDAFFQENPELQERSGTGWKPFNRIKWFHEQRMHGGELPAAGARWIAVEQKEQSGIRSGDEPEWTSIGPMNLGGRMIGITFHPTDANVIYAAAASGGVWKSTDNGAKWNPKTDTTPVLGVGGIAVSKANGDLVVIGTGEGVSWVDRVSGVGVLRSTDAGNTWLTTSLTYQVADGHGFHFVEAGPTGTFLAGASNGLWRSTNGGANWTQVPGPGGAFPGKNFYDAKWEPGSNTVVYACQGNAASGNGVYKSIDDGAKWLYAGTGQPATGAIGKTKLSISAQHPGTVYAVFGGFGFGPGGSPASGPLYRSTDSGSTWSLRNNTVGPGQSWYNLVVAANPSDAQTVIWGGISLYRSTNGGTAWTTLSGPPDFMWTDHHALVYEPGSSSKLWSGNDHGICRSADAGLSWTTANAGLATMQFYDVATNNVPTPYWVLGGAQDNSTWRWPGGGHWLFSASTGDGTGCGIGTVDGTRAYTENQSGFIFLRSTDSGQSWTSAGSSQTGRWVAPFSVDPANAARVYRGLNVGVRKTTDGGATWLPPGGVIAPQNPISISISPANGNTVWWVDKNGVYLTTNDGESWQTANAFGFAVGDSAREILAHPTDANAAFVTFSGYRSVAHVVRTTTLGSTWTNVTGNLSPQPVNAIAINPYDTSEWLIGTDTGVYRSTSGGSSWAPYGMGLPNAVIVDLEIQTSLQKLVAGTYGRGAWEVSLLGRMESAGHDEASGDASVVGTPRDQMPERSGLVGFVPNPGRGETAIRFTVGRMERGEVCISVYDVAGRRVAEVLRERLDSGWREVSWSGKDESGERVSVGIYFVRFEAGDVRETRKLVQLR